MSTINVHEAAIEINEAVESGGSAKLVGLDLYVRRAANADWRYIGDVEDEGSEQAAAIVLECGGNVYAA